MYGQIHLPHLWTILPYLAYLQPNLGKLLNLFIAKVLVMGWAAKMD